MHKGKRHCLIFGIANNINKKAMIEIGGGRNSLSKGDFMSKAVVYSSGEETAMIGRP